MGVESYDLGRFFYPMGIGAPFGGSFDFACFAGVVFAEVLPKNGKSPKDKGLSPENFPKKTHLKRVESSQAFF